MELLGLLEPTEALFDSLRGLGMQIIESGPFRIALDPDSTELWASEAYPMEAMGPATKSASHLANLREIFSSLGRVANVEFNELLWPELPTALRVADFVEYDREPIMVCGRNDFVPRTSDDVRVCFLSPADDDDDLAAFQRIFIEVLVGEKYERTPARVDRVRREAASVGGQGHALATLDGTAAGTGFLTLVGGVGEVARVATVPEARRRGVASTLTSFLAESAFARGAAVIWLTAEDERARSVYAKLGFRAVGDRVAYRAS